MARLVAAEEVLFDSCRACCPKKYRLWHRAEQLVTRIQPLQSANLDQLQELAAWRMAVQMTTWEAKFVYVLEVLLAVALCPKIADAAAPEAVLDT